MAEPKRLRHYTVHLDFVAGSEQEAVVQAAGYAEAMNVLRPEVDAYAARVSADSDWSSSSPAFCGAPGPRLSDRCTHTAGHSGRHARLGAPPWTDDDVPQPPDDIAGCWDSDPPDEEDDSGLVVP